VGALNKWYAEEKERAAFIVVYISEAHPEDGWQVQANRRDNVVLDAPKSYEERKAVARQCEVGLALKIPIAVDKMDDAVQKAYAGWPDRIYVVARDGTVWFQGAPGPAGFRPEEARKALAELLAPSGP
jgi:hypothetical protein